MLYNNTVPPKDSETTDKKMNEKTTTASLGSIGYGACMPNPVPTPASSDTVKQGPNGQTADYVKQEVFTVGGILAIMESLQDLHDKFDTFVESTCVSEEDFEVDEDQPSEDDVIEEEYCQVLNFDSPASYTFEITVPLHKKMTLEEALDTAFKQ